MDNLHLIQLGQYERPTIVEERNKDWVSIGENNDYYQCLIDAYMDSTTNNAVINGVVNCIYGKGLDATDSSKKPDQYAQMRSLLKPKDLRRVCQDLKLLGEASFQITYNKDKIASITHFPRETLRAEKMDSKGNIKHYYYAPDWGAVTRNTKLKKFPVFGSGAQNEIYIIKRYVTGFYYYSPADWGTSYPTLEKEIADYLINDAQSSFSGTKVINFNNGVPDREKQLAIKNDVLGKLTGSYGEKVIVAFNNNAESKTTVEDVPLNDAPAHYEYLSTECQRKIQVMHRVTSPLLIGLRDGNSSLGSNADEIKNANLLFNNVVIQPYQDLIIDALDEIFAYNDISLNLYFKTLEPLEFMDLDNFDNEEQKEEETGIKSEDTELEIMASKTKNNDIPEEVYNAVLEGLKGEPMGSEWEIADIRDYNEENTSADEWANDVIHLAKEPKADTPIKNIPEKGSTLDKSYYAVRYKYDVGTTRGSGGSSRPFCQSLMSRTRQGVVYRIEDINKAMIDKSLFIKYDLPMHNNQTFDLFKFKGGINCRHIWKEVLYKMKIQPALEGKKGSSDLGDYKNVDKIPKSYKPTPRGHKRAAKAERTRSDRGAYPTSK